MTHRNNWSKAVSWEGDDPPNGFERTLPPSDPRARSGAPASGYAVRDNRRQVVFVRETSESVEAQTPPAPTFGEMPVSGVRQLGATDRLRAGIPVARITRDLDDAPFEMDTWFDPRRAPDPVMDLTPDFASEYVPPQPLPEVAQHKTFELRPVRLDPAIHPRTAPTLLNARAVKRRDDKQQKDARELAALLDQAHRRRRGPWIAVAFLIVVAIGFVVGVELVDSSAAGAELGTKPAQEPARASAPAGFVRPPAPARAKPVVGPDRTPTLPSTATAPRSGANPTPATRVTRDRAVAAPAPRKSAAPRASQEANVASTAELPQTPARAGREVWLK